MADLQTFNDGEDSTSVREKINAAIRRINTLDDASEIIAKIDAALGSTTWKDSVLTFDTINDIKQFDVGTISDKTVAIVYASAALGDNLGGIYYWDVTESGAESLPTLVESLTSESGRWVLVSAGGLTGQIETLTKNSTPEALADHQGIRDYIDDNAVSSDLIYSAINGYNGSPTTSGISLDGTPLSFDSGYDSAEGWAEYDIDSFLSGTEAIANIRFVHVEADVRIHADKTPRRASLTVTYPGGETQHLFSTIYESGQSGAESAHKAIFMVPVNSDTTTFRINVSVDENGGGERAAWKIIGASSVLRASGLLTAQVYGGSGMLYSGQEVYTGTAPTDFDPLNLTTFVQGRSQRHYVLLKVENSGGAAANFYARTAGETADVGRVSGSATFAGAGFTGASIDPGEISYVAVLTDESSTIEFKSTADVIITLEAYQPLDDIPVVTNHYLGDVKFISGSDDKGIEIVKPEDDITSGTGWVNVPSNLAWAGASTLLVSANVRLDNSDNSEVSVKIRSENGGEVTTIIDTAAPVTSTDISNNIQVQSLVPVRSDGSFDYNYDDAGQGGYLRSLRVVGYIASNPTTNAYPYWEMKVHAVRTLTNPSQFDDIGVISTSRFPSYGSINTGYNNSDHSGDNSILFTMNVNVLEDTDVTLYLYAVDDHMYTYVDGNYIASASSENYSSDAPKLLTLTLTQGLRQIQIVKHDDRGGSDSFDLVGDIISDTVQFVGFSNVTEIYSDIRSGNDADYQNGIPTGEAVRLFSKGDALLQENGYQVLPSGLIMQWMHIDSPSANANLSSPTLTPWPKQFTSSVFYANISPDGGESNGVEYAVVDWGDTNATELAWYTNTSGIHKVFAIGI